MLIGISGKIGSGKSTLANLLLLSSRMPWEEKSFALKLKQITALVAGVPLETTFTQEGKNIFVPTFNMTVGEMLQRIGTNAMRDGLDENVWIKALFADYKNESNWVVSDVRFPNEADYIKSMGGILVRLEGDPADVRKNSNRDMTHPSETALDDYKGFDAIYSNTGTLEELSNFADTICNHKPSLKVS